MLKLFRIAFKILLCISVLILLDTACCYLFNLRTDSAMDGIYCSSLILQLFFGEDGWTYKLLYDAFSKSFLCTVCLFIVNTVLDVVAIIKNKTA